MPWVKLDDKYPDHPKIDAVGPLAAWLHTCALAYCARHLTDGFIPAGTVGKLANFAGLSLNGAPVQVSDLVVRLTKPLPIPGDSLSALWDEVEGGYQIHDYLEYNPSRAETLAAREKDTTRKRRGTGKPPQATEPGTTEESAGIPDGIRAESKVESRVESERIPAPPVPVPVPHPVPEEDKKKAASSRTQEMGTVHAGGTETSGPDPPPDPSRDWSEEGQEDFESGLAEGIAAARRACPTQFQAIDRLVRGWHRGRKPRDVCRQILSRIAERKPRNVTTYARSIMRVEEQNWHEAHRLKQHQALKAREREERVRGRPTVTVANREPTKLDVAVASTLGNLEELAKRNGRVCPEKVAV